MNSIQVNSTFMGLAIDIDNPLAYSEKLFWRVSNTIDSLNASIPSNR